MALSFPNRSRSFDATRRAVRFWGHDTAMESSFFVTEDALKHIQPDMQLDEDSLLSAFDSNRDWICAVAAKVYSRGRKGCYEVVAGDFRAEPRLRRARAAVQPKTSARRWFGAWQ
jgi:Protein of unknown function (DUF1488)